MFVNFECLDVEIYHPVLLLAHSFEERVILVESAYVRIRQDTSACGSIRQHHQSVSIHQDTSGYIAHSIDLGVIGVTDLLLRRLIKIHLVPVYVSSGSSCTSIGKICRYL